ACPQQPRGPERPAGGAPPDMLGPGGPGGPGAAADGRGEGDAAHARQASSSLLEPVSPSLGSMEVSPASRLATERAWRDEAEERVAMLEQQVLEAEQRAQAQRQAWRAAGPALGPAPLTRAPSPLRPASPR
ncbi:unnamed protein product, partial [Prorocentrum cordatum]